MMKSKFRLVFLAVYLLSSVILTSMLTNSGVQAQTQLPCDIFASGGTPCAAAHSTTRALSAAYNGRLYQVKRSSDNATTDISTLSAGGYANSAAQDTFCSGTTCIITIIYDQTSNHNDLPIEGAGGAGVADHGATANEWKVSAAGHNVYGMWSDGQTAYRDNATTGIAKGSQPQGQYAVFSGTHFNDLCCFDYGNTEETNTDTGNGHMDAIYFGTAHCCSSWTHSGPGPAWVAADLENGMFFGANGPNAQNTGINATFVTAMTKSDGTANYVIEGGNADSGGLITWWNGSLPTSPSGYIPLHQEGGIVLGSGGDNSNGDIGAWLEGAMTSGEPSDASLNAIQANLVSIAYTNVSQPAGTSTPTLTPTIPPVGGLVKINTGGPAVSPFVSDTDYDFGTANGTSNTVTTSGVTNPAPMAVYQTEHWCGCQMTYTIPGETPNASYLVRLHFAEIFFSAAGQRQFNVAINGTQVLTNFDVFAAAGGADKAIVKEFTTTANASGKIILVFSPGAADNPKINGIEILTGSGGTATPTFVPATNTPGAEAPFGGTRPNMPGTVQAENYDTGGQNVGYSKPAAGTSTLAYRSDENAQIETTSDTGGGADVGWTNTNDWYKYMVNVTSAGTYSLNIRVASPNTTSAYHVEVDGTNVTGSTTVPNTGGWQTYTTLTKTGVSLSAGAHTLRLVVDNGGMNFNWISVTSATQHTGAVSINAGGSAAGSFIADADFSGGTLYSNTNTIDTSGVTNPAPAAVYQTERWGAMTYTIPNLTPNSTYTVRLHFAEIYHTAAGQRIFNVAINGTTVLSNFDIFAAAGGANKAIVEQFSATANASGQIVIAFTLGSVDNPKISGIEVQ